MSEVFLGERLGNQARFLRRQRGQAHPAGNVCPKVGGVADGIAQGNRIEVDEDHTVARQKNMVCLQVGAGGTSSRPATTAAVIALTSSFACGQAH